MRKTIAAAFSAAFISSGVLHAEETSGLIFVMRHTDKAATPAEQAASPAGFDRDCNPKDGLSPAGVDRASAAAAELSTVLFAEAYSSDMCRTAHVAYIVSGDPAPEVVSDPNDDAAGFFAAMADRATAAGGKGGNILVVLHSNWIAPLFDGVHAEVTAPSWAAPQCYGDVRAFRVENGRWVYAASYQTAVSYIEYGECVDGG
ncbi:MAG: histidine phosphatase family protein [Amphiplicatus sp.]